MTRRGPAPQAARAAARVSLTEGLLIQARTPLPGIPAALWERIPLAKQRLAHEGPMISGRRAAMDSALVIAAELRLQGVSEPVAQEACQHLCFSADSTPARLVRRQLRDSVRFAYAPRDGSPILTGCPASARVSTTGSPARSLRNVFAPYCDAQCCATCGILRSRRDPASVVLASSYRHVYTSSLWARGAGLNLIGRDLYARLAALAVAAKGDTVRASSRWLNGQTGHLHDSAHVRRVLKRMEQIGLITLLDRKTALRVVHVRPKSWVRRQEESLGTWRTRERNRQSDRRDQDAYLDYLCEWDDRDELVAGTGWGERIGVTAR